MVVGQLRGPAPTGPPQGFSGMCFVFTVRPTRTRNGYGQQERGGRRADYGTREKVFSEGRKRQVVGQKAGHENTKHPHGGKGPQARGESLPRVTGINHQTAPGIKAGDGGPNQETPLVLRGGGETGGKQITTGRGGGTKRGNFSSKRVGKGDKTI